MLKNHWLNKFKFTSIPFCQERTYWSHTLKYYWETVFKHIFFFQYTEKRVENKMSEKEQLWQTLTKDVLKCGKTVSSVWFIFSIKTESSNKKLCKGKLLVGEKDVAEITDVKLECAVMYPLAMWNNSGLSITV